MNPGAHGQLRDEDITTLGEQNGCLRRDHLDFRIRFHHLLDTSEGQLVDFVIMVVRFQVVNDMLPIGCQDIAGRPLETLIDLIMREW